MTRTVVVAFSGGLDTSWCVPWLRESLEAEVITVTVDVGGFTAHERDRLACLSRTLGAREHHCLDAREVFFDEVLRFLIAGNVLRGHLYPLCVGSERVLQAREVARLAQELGATAIAHGCTAAGNDQVRFQAALSAFAPELEILAPIQEQEPSRVEELAFLEARGLPVPPFGADYSVNSGLWGVTIGGQETCGTTEPLPEDAWVRTRHAFESPRAPERLRIGFVAGVPTSLDEVPMDPVTLLETLDRQASAFGIGRGIHLGDTILGCKGRVAFEAPTATVLIQAHRELEKLTLTGRQQKLKDSLACTYGDLVHEGQFLEPTCRNIEAFLTASQVRVTGTVQVLLRPGSLFVEGVRSQYSLHAASRTVYGETAGEWTPADALGFSRITAIPGLLHARAGRQLPSEEHHHEDHPAGQDRLGHPELPALPAGASGHGVAVSRGRRPGRPGEEQQGALQPARADHRTLLANQAG